MSPMSVTRTCSEVFVDTHCGSLVWQKMPRASYLCAFLLLVITAGCRHDEKTAPPGPPQHIRITQSVPGSGSQAFVQALVRAYELSLPSIVFETRPTAGVISNLDALQSGEADVAFAFADVTYLAFTGELKDAHERFDRLRGIAVLQLNPVHLVTRANSGINSIENLRGKRVGIGSPASGTAFTANLLLSAFGLGPGAVQLENLVPSEANRRLLNGGLDAFFSIGSAPNERIKQAMTDGAVLVPLSGKTIDDFRHLHPFLRRTVIASGTYPNQQNAIQSMGVDNLLLCRAELPEAIVYLLTRTLFEVLPTLVDQQESVRSIDLERAPGTPVPLHEGAARYYRERQLGR